MRFAICNGVLQPMEPMEYVPDGPGAAARAIGYARGILETLAEGLRAG